MYIIESLYKVIISRLVKTSSSFENKVELASYEGSGERNA